MTATLSRLFSSPFNPILCIDGYKLDHRRQYPDGTERVLSNFTARGSRVLGVNRVPFVGLQAFLQRYLMDELEAFFAADVDEVCAEYERRVNGYLGPNAIGTDHIRALHALGYVPLEFRALPEGTCVPLRVPMFTIENTHDDFAWLVNYYETQLSASLWLPCTSAANAMRLRELLDLAAKWTGTDVGFVQWQGHDFSYRGMGGLEAAALSGFGHLCAFTGTDTIPAIDFIERYYDAPSGYLIGGSVPATEHSVMCAGGKDDEQDTYTRLLELYPTGILSVVSDTWDLWHVLTKTLPALKGKILARDGKLVIRPDSGDPIKIICGDPEAPAGTPEHAGVVELLWDTFGGTVTPKGFRQIDSHVGVIYGDAINYARAEAIMQGLSAKGFASGNIVFGVGSFTYQFVTRDTFNFAIKATWTQRDGKGYALFKEPKTDDGVKNSARGRLAVFSSPTRGLHVVENATPEQEAESLLQPVWRDGRFLSRISIADIRTRIRA